MAEAEKFHCQSNGADCGPYSRDEIESFIARGLFNMGDTVYIPSTGQWIPVSQFLSGQLGPTFDELVRQIDAEAESNPLNPPPMRGDINPKIITPPERDPAYDLTGYESEYKSESPGFFASAFAWVANTATTIIASILATVAVIIVIGLINKGCYAVRTKNIGEDEAIVAHNSMVEIVEAYKTKRAEEIGNNDLLTFIAVTMETASKLESIDTSDSPAAYQNMFKRLIEIVRGMTNALQLEDTESYKRLNREMETVISELTGIMVDTGNYKVQPDVKPNPTD